VSDPIRQTLYEDLELPLVLAPGPDSPSRTRAKAPAPLAPPPVFQTAALHGGRPDVEAEIARPPVSVRAVGRAGGQRLIDLAREAMVTRGRDLDVFEYGSPEDVRLVDCGDGLRFACIGAIPERRLLLEAVYGLLTLKNGVPTGYVLVSALFGSSELAFNVFETFRGGESGRIYGRVLAIARHLFGADTFTIFPYQLGGYGNPEALKSGAWWFYQKLGFRPRDAGVRTLMDDELLRTKRDPSHRSSIATLKKLAAENLYFHAGTQREDVIGILDLPEVGLKVTDAVAKRFGADREAAARASSREAMALVEIRTLAGWSAGERLAWERWAPLVCILPGISRWSPSQKRSLAKVVKAKGGRRESEFVRLFDAHRPLRRAIRALAAAG
jgi:hypothetical protein